MDGRNDTRSMAAMADAERGRKQAAAVDRLIAAESTGSAEPSPRPRKSWAGGGGSTNMQDKPLTKLQVAIGIVVWSSMFYAALTIGGVSR